MKTIRSLGPVVAFCLPGFVAVVPALQRTAPDPLPAPPPPTHSVEIRHREGARYLLSASLPVVTDVRATVEGALALAAPGDAVASTRSALEQRYGARVSEEAALPGYTWWFNGERWILICVPLDSTFAVDFGPRGTVEVKTRDWTVIP